MGTLWHDIRYSVRTLAKHPGFVIAGVVVLALGIGVNTAIFSLVNAVLFRQPPVRAPEELRYVYTVAPPTPMPYGATTYREFRDLREQNTVFSDVLLVTATRDRLRIGSGIHLTAGEMVSINYFDLLGVQPFMGRAFAAGEDEAAAGTPVVIISYDLWQSRFNGDPDVIGKAVAMTRTSYAGTYNPWKAYAVVGVMPRGFRGIASPWEPTQYWVSFLQRAAITSAEDPRYKTGPGPRPGPLDFGGLPIGRLKPGVTDDQASAAIAAAAGEFRRRYPRAVRDWSLVLLQSRHVRFPFDPRGQTMPGRLAAALMAVSAVLLLIAAANLAGMLMARGVARRGEIAVRLTLGAGRWRLTRQLMTESLLLSAAGGLLGLIVARWLIDLFIAGSPAQFVRWQISLLALDVVIDGRVLLVTAASCLLTGAVVSLGPARQALTADLLTGLSGGAYGATRRVGGALRRWIVVPQVCLSLTLLLVAGALVRSLIESELRHPGYDPDQVVLIDFEVPASARIGQQLTPAERDAQNEARVRLNRRILERARASAPITAVSLTMTAPTIQVPLPMMHTWVIPREGFRPDGRHHWTAYASVSNEYFDTLQIPLLRGRLFDERDREGTPPVTIVSEDVARLIWPGRDPIGDHLARHWPDSPYPPQWMEVVGVVRDVVPPLSDARWNPAIYTPLEQDRSPQASTLLARGSGPPGDILEALEAAIGAAEPTAIAARGRTLEDAIGEILYPRRVAAALLALAGAIGLLLASAGLYGVVSYGVEQRVREIGVRMALGAERRDIIRLIVREGVRVAVGGTALGFVAGYAAIRLTSSMVIAIPTLDVATVLTVPLLLAAAVLLACYIPALRAARVEPMIVLRGL